jgi:hypothetical protein
MQRGTEQTKHTQSRPNENDEYRRHPGADAAVEVVAHLAGRRRGGGHVCDLAHDEIGYLRQIHGAQKSQLASATVMMLNTV